MTLVYATTGDYETYAGLTPGSAPAGTTSRLAHASRLVTRTTIHDLYDVDGTGLPTSPTVAAAMRDATCAHALAVTTAGLDPTAGLPGVTLPAGSSTLGTASVTTDPAATATVAAATVDLLTTLTPDAVLILREAGLARAHPGRAWCSPRTG